MIQSRWHPGARVHRWILAVAIVALGGCHADEISGPNPAFSTRRLSVGEATVCALDAVGKVYCWGSNSAALWEYGANPATLPQSSVPVSVPLATFVRVNGGSGPHMCGITSSNGAVCWGRGGMGQLGGGTIGDSTKGNPATPVQGTANWSDITVSRLSTCALAVTGTGYCWGSNQRGEVGDTAVAIGARTTSPSAVRGAIVFKSIVAGWLHACGISISGATYCWGDNASGQLGIGFADAEAHRQPLLVSFTESFVQLSLGARSTCGITPDHRALCWGLNTTGQLGNGTTTAIIGSPTPVAGGLKFVQIALASGFAGGTNVPTPNTLQAGSAHTCALTETGVPYCWGWNGAGQLGDGTTTDRFTPVPVQGNLRLGSIGLGGSSTCGMNGNAVWCWGSNFAGQLGNGTAGNSPVPIAVITPFNKP